MIVHWTTQSPVIFNQPLFINDNPMILQFPWKTSMISCLLTWKSHDVSHSFPWNSHQTPFNIPWKFPWYKSHPLISIKKTSLNPTHDMLSINKKIRSTPMVKTHLAESFQAARQVYRVTHTAELHLPEIRITVGWRCILRWEWFALGNTAKNRGFLKGTIYQCTNWEILGVPCTVSVYVNMI
jgi:hypothetical protein